MLNRALMLAAALVLFATTTANAAFSGTIKFRERGGNDTYVVHVMHGVVKSGWAGDEGNPRYTINSGWYDGRMLAVVLRYEGALDDVRNTFHILYLRHRKNSFVLEKLIIRDGEAKAGGNVYRILEMD